MQGIQLPRHCRPILLHLLIELCERLFDPPRPFFLSASGGDCEWRTEHGALFACTGRDRSVEVQETQRDAYAGRESVPFGARSCDATVGGRFAGATPPRRPSRDGWVCTGVGLTAGCTESTTISIFIGRPGQGYRGGSERTTRETLTSVDELAVVLGAGDGRVPRTLERDDGHALRAPLGVVDEKGLSERTDGLAKEVLLAHASERVARRKEGHFPRLRVHRRPVGDG